VRDVMECLTSRFAWADALVALPMGDSRKPLRRSGTYAIWAAKRL
jgi:hypothetical protein